MSACCPSEGFKVNKGFLHQMGGLKMNIVYIHTHDTGKYIQPYGYQVPTPYLMDLARDGVLFRHMFSAAPTCSASRSALMTGMSPHSCGMNGLAHRGFQMTDYKHHLAAYLKSFGIETVLCGIQHEAPDRSMLGYDYILNEPYAPEDLDQNSVELDKHHAKLAADYLMQTQERPFFLSLGLYNTHREFPISEKVNPDYVTPPFPMYDTPENREDMAGFIGSAKVVDECVGIVLEALESADCKRKTLVIFSTDHGLAFPQMKCSLYDAGIGVSFIMRFPEGAHTGHVVDEMASQVDVFPTICDWFGIDKPDWLEGVSLMPLIEGEVKQVRETCFAEVSYHAAYEPMRMVRTPRYKLIKRFYEYQSVIAANIDDSLSKDFLLNHGYGERKQAKVMLFDLYLDPLERENLADHPSYEAIYADLDRKLYQWMKQTKDPLLERGIVLKPQGAVVNKQDAVSPREPVFE
jgi:N-sulfoglucosamine sulfohydrolase